MTFEQQNQKILRKKLFFSEKNLGKTNFLKKILKENFVFIKFEKILNFFFQLQVSIRSAKKKRKFCFYKI